MTLTVDILTSGSTHAERLLRNVYGLLDLEIDRVDRSSRAHIAADRSFSSTRSISGSGSTASYTRGMVTFGVDRPIGLTVKIG